MNRKIIQMPNYNYYKTISANMLVTTHDLNFVMGFIKEDEIYNPQTGVSELPLQPRIANSTATN